MAAGTGFSRFRVPAIQRVAGTPLPLLQLCCRSDEWGRLNVIRRIPSVPSRPARPEPPPCTAEFQPHQVLYIQPALGRAGPGSYPIIRQSGLWPD